MCHRPAHDFCGAAYRYWPTSILCILFWQEWARAHWLTMPTRYTTFCNRCYGWTARMLALNTAEAAAALSVRSSTVAGLAIRKFLAPTENSGHLVWCSRLGQARPGAVGRLCPSSRPVPARRVASVPRSAAWATGRAYRRGIRGALSRDRTRVP